MPGSNDRKQVPRPSSRPTSGASRPPLALVPSQPPPLPQPAVDTLQASELTPTHPVDIARSLEVPVLGLYGGADQGIPISTIEQMRTALERGSSGSQIVVYEDAPHGFNADYRPSYRKDTATDGWKRMAAWFKSHGVA